MKTIRPSTYETNSSSTHSVVIVRNAIDRKEPDAPPPFYIEESQTLIPKNLRYESVTYGVASLNAKTAVEKAALIYNYFVSFIYDNSYDHSRWRDHKQYLMDAYRNALITHEDIPIKEITHDKNECSSFSVYTEDGAVEFIEELEEITDNDDLSADEIIRKINSTIIECMKLITDPKTHIIDTDVDS